MSAISTQQQNLCRYVVKLLEPATDLDVLLAAKIKIPKPKPLLFASKVFDDKWEREKLGPRLIVGCWEVWVSRAWLEYNSKRTIIYPDLEKGIRWQFVDEDKILTM